MNYGFIQIQRENHRNIYQTMNIIQMIILSTNQLMVTAAISEPSNTLDGKVGILYHGDVTPARKNSVRPSHVQLSLWNCIQR